MRKALNCWAALTALVLVGGCHSEFSDSIFGTSLWNPFDLKPLFAVDTEPIRIGVATDGCCMWDVRAWWDLRDRTPFTELRRALARHAGRPVQIEQLKDFQLAAQLESGRLDFALLTHGQYKQLKEQADTVDAIAYADVPDKTGLLVASADSGIRSISDVAGHRFAFGPHGDPILHHGAAAALEAAGVTLSDITREIVPIYQLQYHISSREAAKEVVYGLTPAGVIAKSDYEQYPESGGRFFPLSFSRDQFRVLGETKPVDFGPFVASSRTDPALVDRVRTFLLAAATDTPRVTDSLGVAAFTGATSRNQ